jgi:chromate transporter
VTGQATHTDAPSGPPTFGELAASSWKVGLLGFGGPAGQIALMHRIFVDEKRWVDEDRYLHALSYCTLLPGPEAQQLATYIGWLLHGVRGGVIAGVLFILPGMALILGLSWLYAAHGETPLVAGLFYGIKAAVVALVIEAMIKVGKRALKGAADLWIAVLAFVALALFGAPFPIVVLGAGLWGLASGARGAEPAAPRRPGLARGAAKAALLWGGLWLTPPLACLLLLGPDHLLSQVGRLFSTLSVVTFGGAYAALAYLQQQAVSVQGWLSAAQMIDGLGLAETTPGPLVLVNQHVGFMAGWNAQAGWPLAVAAALMASWCTFAPSFLWIFAGAPFAETLRQSPRARAALKAITAAVLGVIANLAVWFALHVLFTRTREMSTPWGRLIAMPDIGAFDPLAALLTIAAIFALLRFKVNVAALVAAAAVIGLLTSLWR